MRHYRELSGTPYCSFTTVFNDMEQFKIQANFL